VDPSIGLLARAERVLTENVPAAPDDVRVFYTDLDNLKELHPLIVSVRRTDRKETHEGYEQTYRVTDRIPLGPFSLPIRYVARLRTLTSGEVKTEARQFPRVRLRGTVTFEPIGSATRISERIIIEAPRLLAGVTTRQAVKAHAEMLAGIRRHFGG
jgi:hypothetical protein